MAGYPFAGKSYVAQLLAEKLPRVSLINPKTFRTDDYESLSEEDKRDQNLAVWEVSLDLLADLKKEKDSEIFIYDTACANLERMRPYFQDARRFKHHVIYLFVSAELAKCKERAGKAWLPEDVIDKYTRNFETGASKFSSLAHKTFVVPNDTDAAPDLAKVISYVTAYYSQS